MPPLNPTDSDKYDNEKDVLPLLSTYNGEEDNDPELALLPPVDSAEEGKISDDMGITYRGSTLDLGSKV